MWKDWGTLSMHVKTEQTAKADVSNTGMAFRRNVSDFKVKYWVSLDFR